MKRIGNRMTLIVNGVTLIVNGMTLIANGVTLIVNGMTLIANGVTLIANRVTSVQVLYIHIRSGNMRSKLVNNTRCYHSLSTLHRLDCG